MYATVFAIVVALTFAYANAGTQECVEECTDTLMTKLSGNKDIGSVCKSYYDYKSCITSCPDGETVWRMAAKQSGKTGEIEDTCRTQGRRRRDTTEQKVDEVAVETTVDAGKVEATAAVVKRVARSF